MISELKKQISTLLSCEDYPLTQALKMIDFYILGLYAASEEGSLNLSLEAMDPDSFSVIAQAVSEYEPSYLDTLDEVNALFNIFGEKIDAEYAEEIFSLSENLFEDYNEDDWYEEMDLFYSQFSKHEKDLRLLLLSDLNGLEDVEWNASKNALYTFILNYQWFVLSFVLARQELFYHYYLGTQSFISSEEIKESLNRWQSFAKMSKDSFTEYFDQDFEDSIWNFEYTDILLA